MTIKKGATRAVLLIGAYALKFPRLISWKHFLWGLLGNMQEREFSKTGWPQLAPVVFAIPCGFFVVMRRAEPITDKQWLEIDVDTWRERGEYTIPVESKQSSFGVINGEIVAVDYGGGW